MNAQPGWYADPHDATTLRYWDGNAWTGHITQARQPIKSLTTAWILALLLGGFGAHLFYVRRPVFAGFLLLTSVASAFLAVTGLGLFLFAASVILWIVSVVNLSSDVNRLNRP